MRDPAATKAEIEAAIEGACEEFRRLKGLGWFPKKLPFDVQLRGEALNLIERLPDEVMPPHLRDYIWGVLSKTRGLRRTYAVDRDGHIWDAVYGAMRRGFPPTRNEATRRKEALGEPAAQSACSIVTKALARVGVHMSERSIEDIWAAQSKLLERSRAERAARSPVVTAVGLGQVFLADSTESTPTPPQGKPRVR